MKPQQTLATLPLGRCLSSVNRLRFAEWPLERNFLDTQKSYTTPSLIDMSQEIK
jgi:hypothetical protein